VATIPVAQPDGNPAAFCADIQNLLLLLPRLVARGDPPSNVADAKALIARVQKDAPSAVAAQVHQVVQTDQRIVGDLSANPPQLTDLAEAVQDPAYQLALREVGAYAFAHCNGG
jgi:hypothetical protein